MVRIRTKTSKALELTPPSRESSRKRKLNENVGNVGVKVNSGGTPTVPSRSSKRTRNSNVPYQSPESVDALISFVTTQKKVAAKIKNEKTPKATAKQRQALSKQPRTPVKAVKRLQKKVTVKDNVKNSKPPVRRKLLKSPVPAKAERKAKIAKGTKKSTVVKDVKKIAKQILKRTLKPKETNMATHSTPTSLKRKRKGSRPNDKSDESKNETGIKGVKTIKTGPSPKKGKLKARPELKNYDKDPTFETRLEIPFISTVAHSRLLIRAVILNDMKLLKKLINQESDNIYTVCMVRSAQHHENVMDYIIKLENKEAFKILHKIPEKVVKKFGTCPDVMLSEEGTGRGNFRMFGHALRQVAVGRGGKEGNNAFLYDIHTSYHISATPLFNGDHWVQEAIKRGASLDFVDFLMKELSIQSLNYTDIHLIMRRGHYEHAGRAIVQANKRGGYGFNFLHEEALTKTSGNSLTAFKPISVTKKCSYEPRFNPLHCAAINPNVDVLTELLRAMPDYNVADSQGWTVGHYASVCCSPEPLKHLLKFGISPNTVTTTKRGGDGYTMLHAAVAAGRTENVKVILDHEQKAATENITGNVKQDGEDDGDTKKKTGVNMVLFQNDIRYKPTTNGQNALHMACHLGHVDIVKLLLAADVDPNRPTPAKYDKQTPLMIATLHGHLDIVKLLVDAGVKVDAKDKRGRTAAHYAAMNGQTHVLSFLLRLGCNHLAVDTSGNTLMHYSTAYGWYFATLLLLEAGCPPNATNTWKMTPLAIAFMKGHTGLVVVLMKQEGVDVNARINDSTGRTLLLEICVAGWDLKRLKFLIDELKADPKCEDFNGNNALHLVTQPELKDAWVDDFKKKITPFNDCVTYLVEKGCDPHKKNLDDVSSILNAASRNHFYFISRLLDLNIKMEFEKDKSGNTLLHYMAKYFTQADKVILTVFNKLCDDADNLRVLIQMADTHNKEEGVTPFLILMQSSLNSYNAEVQQKLTEFIEKFLTKITININAQMQDKSKRTALHVAVRSPLLPKILQQNPFLDPLDNESQTPLVIAVTGGHYEAAEQLIDAGASVHLNFKKEFNISLLLYYVMKETQSFSLVRKIIAKGGNAHEIHPKTKNSMLHYIARKPTFRNSLDALNAVLDAGVSPNLINCDGRTAMHLAVNMRGSETDVFYDIEDALITAGVNLGIKDHRKRTALHYAFVKIGKPTDTSFFDPIELVSHLVTSMKSSGNAADIHCKDVYGSTALHYSAFRGATICSSLLIQSLAQGGEEIDTCDSNGNTAFALAVRNQHEGCALNFYQKDADFLRTINNDIKIQEVHLEGSSLQKKKTEEVWNWNHVACINEEKDKLREQEEKYPILEQVVKHNWQGLLYLMIGQLQSSGVGFSTGISTALKTNRLKLALKLTLKVKQKKEMAMESGTLFHSVSKYYNGQDEDLISKICEAFWKIGLDSTKTDEFDSQPVIYALANQQISLCNILIKAKQGSTLHFQKLVSIKPDLFGRTPFTTLFWKLTPPYIPTDVQDFVGQLLTSGANPNQLCEYPIKLTSYPGVRFRKMLTEIIPSNGTRYPPLIIAVITNCPATIKWLLTYQGGPHPVDVNAQDSDGLTAMHHAVRLNDYKMAKLLIDPKNYNYSEDTDGLKAIRIKSGSTAINISVKDKQGWTVMDYLILSPAKHCHYKNVHSMFKLLQQLDAINVVSGNGVTPVDRAIRHKRSDLIELFSKHTLVPATKKQLAVEEYSDLGAMYSQDILHLPVKDFGATAEKMADILIEKSRKKLKESGEDDELKIQPDPLCGLDKQNAEVIIDEKQNIPYDLIMTKVDLNYGFHGLYNFYKMQLIKQPRGKEMIILFTQWGRVGDQGQYQKTPFATEEEAIKEFTKIFKAKSGNSWDDVQNFNPIPNKYRLVKKDLQLVKYSTQVSVNFDELEKAGKNLKTSLSQSIIELMKQLCEVHRDAGSSYGNKRYYYHQYQTQPDYCNLPLLPVDILVKGESILKEIGSLITKKDEMQSDTKGKYTEQDKLEAMNQIVKLSEDFYQIIPVFGHSTEKLEPVFNDNDLREKLIAISRLIHLELAKSVMLASQYNQATINPFEYVYRCLGSKIQLLDRTGNARDREECDIILQYVANTSENAKVFGIYRVQIPLENERLAASNIQNRQLLWHGTSSANMLSILQNGLQVAPLSAELSGHLFGKGVYLADVFAKSQKYCTGDSGNGKNRKYILLCEAALGKIYEVKLDEAGEKPMPSGYNCIKSAGCKYEPNPESAILWKGRTVALGEKKEIHYKDDGNYYWRLDHNEYIIFNVDQIAVRYLIEFED